MNYDLVDEFLGAVRKSGLLSEGSLVSLTQEFKLQSPGSQEELAAKLVERNLLTPFQAERILLGEAEDCVLAGRYHILEKIGSGGMGSVYRALDTKLNRVVAIKLMAPHNLSNPDAVDRFKREARALAQLALPQIVQAFDSGEDRGRNFLVMEFVKGVGLDKLLREKGKFPATIAADYIYQAAVGLQPAHDRGMIHRDLKPGNLLLTSEGGVKILDLGLARFVQDQIPDSERTRENIGMGTPDYMAPEQFRDARSVDVRADIYSLGCTLYQLIAGLTPFPGSSLSEKVYAHENKEPPPLEERSPEIPAGLALAVAKMMAKRPVDRFQSMRAAAEALAPYVAGSSVSLPQIRQTATWQSDQLFGQRRRLPWAKLIGAGAVLVAATAAFVLLLSGFWRDPDPVKDTPLAQITPPSEFKPKSKTPEDKKLPEKKIEPSPVKTLEPTKTPTETPAVVKKVEPSPPPKKPAPPEIVMIPNGITVAQDGSGQFKSIAAALDKAQAGMTIRILDQAAYQEQIHIADPERQKDITLDAPKNAVLEMSPSNQFGLKIDGVPGVKIKGLHFQSKNHPVDLLKSIPVFCVQVTAGSAGVSLENLKVRTTDKVGGIVVYNAPLQESDPPIVVRDCQLQVGGYGLYVTGSPTVMTSNVILRDNTVAAIKGITLEMTLSDIQVTGNFVLNCDMTNMELMNLVPKTKSILIANNTFYGGGTSLRLWDTFPFAKTPVNALTIRNNLMFGSTNMDFYYYRAEKSLGADKGTDSGFLLKICEFGQNYRDLAGGELRNVTPLAPLDREVTRKEFVSLISSNADFLRPKKTSLLATQGAGKDDPAFPTYVGAIPPEGVTPWDWSTTWKLRRAEKK